MSSVRLTLQSLEDRNVPAAGDIDPTFGSGGRVVIPFDLGDNNDYAESIKIQPDGKIVIAGFATFDATTYDFAVTRLNPDGSFDTTFDGDGKTTITVREGGLGDDEVVGLALQTDGKIVIVGNAAATDRNENFAIIRLNTDGSLDTSFSGDGKMSVSFDIGGDLTDHARNVVIDPSGKIVVVGFANVGVTSGGSNTNDFAVSRLNPNGTLDDTFDGDGRQTIGFDIGGSKSDLGYTIGLQSDGKIVVGGLARIGTDNFDFAVARLNTNGSIDNTYDGDGRQTVAFDGSGTNIEDRGRSLVIQPDGKTVMSGFRHVTDTNLDFAIIRLNTDGSLDSTFGGDGRQTVAFNVGGSQDDRARSMILQPDGKFVLVGSVQIGDVDDGFGIARLNSDGSLDTSFNGTGRKTVAFDLGGDLIDRARGVAVQADGNLVVAGYARNTNGAYDFAVVRLLGSSPVVPPPGTVPPGTSPPPGTVPPGTSPPTTTPPVTVPPGQVIPAFAVGIGPGVPSIVIAYEATGNEAFRFDPFGGFTGGVRVSTADVNNDGIPDIIAGTGPGIATAVKVINGSTQTQMFAFAAFESSFTAGVYVAAGDINGDGFADIAISPDEGGGPRIRLFDGKTGDPLADFFGIDDPNFRGGARVSIADVNGDGTGDILVAAGFGGGPRLAVFDGRTVRNGQTPVKLFGDFFVFEETLRNGIFIAGGDLTGDGKAEVIAGGGPGGGPRVFALSGSDLLTGKQTQVANFFAGNDSNRGGVRIAARNLDGDNKLDIIAGTGPVTTLTSSGAKVTSYAGSVIGSTTPPAVLNFDAFPSFNNGIFVG